MDEQKYLRKVTDVSVAETVEDNDTLILIRSGKAMRVPTSAIGEKVSTAAAVSSVVDEDTIPIVRSGSVYRAPASALATKPAIYMYSSGDSSFHTLDGNYSKVTKDMMAEALKNGVVRYCKFDSSGSMDIAITNGLGTILSYQYKDCKHTFFGTIAGGNESYVVT